jgi:aldehyde:ferredoxin oxidoreductase
MPDNIQTPAPGVQPAPPPSPAAPSYPGGYNGQILRVNLSTGSITFEKVPADFWRQYLGGAGFVAYHLWKELKAGVDPLGPENILIFALGPVSGYVLPGASRNCIGAKSPLTGGIAKSECGGFWMAELKRAGCDAIVVEGRASGPVYLWVHDGQAEIRDARHLWGKETLETEAAIRGELGDEHIHVAMIGPGGENLVKFACLMEGAHDTAGRGGTGAVMGSKYLKAIAVRGHTLPPLANEDKLKEIRQQLASRVHPMSQYGTGGMDMIGGEAQGNLPVRNFRDGLFPQVKEITAVVLKESGLRTGMEGCFACPVRCKKVVMLEEPYKVAAGYGGPEYETLASLGSNCGVSDLKAICRGNALCNAYSLDTISTGATIAFAMECFERGLLTAQDTGGLELRFGNAEAMLQAIEAIARRKGFGDLLAEGTKKAAEKIGRGASEFAVQVKGLEAGMHEPRIKPAMALGFMTGAAGADHCGHIMDGMVANEAMFKQYHPLGWQKPLPISDFGPRKIALFKVGECNAMVIDSLVVCSFVGFNPELQVETLKAITGWDTGLPELQKIGERILTVLRLFNIREGLTAADDVLPPRFFQPKTDGVVSKIKLDRELYEKGKKYYYLLMGWDQQGIPLPEKVEELYIE